MTRFIILSGPSCVGKGPLRAAIAKFAPELHSKLHGVVLFTSRNRRENEVNGKDYHFPPGNNPAERITWMEAELRSDPNFLLYQVRSDLQALDIKELESITRQETGIVYLETFHTIVPELEKRSLSGIDLKTVFLSPLSASEVKAIMKVGGTAGLNKEITALMKRKLEIRVLLGLSNEDNNKIEERAASACVELRSAPIYDYVIPNHDAEGSPNWGTNYLFGDATRAYRSMVSILKGKQPEYYEKWDDDLFD